jgi:hypothetical protein
MTNKPDVIKAALTSSKGYRDALKEGTEAVEKAALSVGKQESVLYKEIWNEAIEAAAKIADDADELAAKWIRNLKK